MGHGLVQVPVLSLSTLAGKRGREVGEGKGLAFQRAVRVSFQQEGDAYNEDKISMDSYGFFPLFSFFFKISQKTHQLSLATFFRMDMLVWLSPATLRVLFQNKDLLCPMLDVKENTQPIPPRC